jgi:hypothetical protein
MVIKIFDGRKNLPVPEDEEISISSLNEKTITHYSVKMLTFFSIAGYKYSMDVLQDVRGRKIQYIKLIPINAKEIQRKEILLGIDVQNTYL